MESIQINQQYVDPPTSDIHQDHTNLYSSFRQLTYRNIAVCRYYNYDFSLLYRHRQTTNLNLYLPTRKHMVKN